MYCIDVTNRIRCYRFGRMRQSNGWERLDVRRVERNLLVFMIGGNAVFSIEGREIVVTAGDVLVIPDKTLYKAYTDSFCEYYFFHFSGDIKEDEMPTFAPIPRRFSFDLCQSDSDVIYFPQKISLKDEENSVHKSVILCTDYHARTSRMGIKMLENEFLKILLTIAEMAERAKSSNGMPSSLEKMIVYIKKNLTRPISVRDICESCNLSASYAGRLFKRYLNTTVTEYVNDEKLYYAVELMNDTKMNITEISDYLGYCDVYNFSKRFKRKFGCSPSQIKNKKC